MAQIKNLKTGKTYKVTEKEKKSIFDNPITNTKFVEIENKEAVKTPKELKENKESK